MPISASHLAVIMARMKPLIAGLDIQLPAGQIDEANPLFEGGLGLDSVAVVELIGSIEREFGIEFPEQDLTPESFQNLGTLASVVASNVPLQA